VLAKGWAGENVVVPPGAGPEAARRIRSAIPPFKRHSYFASLRSSQALAQTIFGSLAELGRVDALAGVRADCGRPAFFESSNGWSLRLEHEVAHLGERASRRTSADVFLEVGAEGSRSSASWQRRASAAARGRSCVRATPPTAGSSATGATARNAAAASDAR
jgi:hypothetical protein